MLRAFFDRLLQAAHLLHRKWVWRLAQRFYWEFAILQLTLLLCKIARVVSSLPILIFKPYGAPVRRKKNPRRVRRFNTFSRKVLTVWD